METIDPPCAARDFLSLSATAPATAIAVAEQVPVQADSFAAIASSSAPAATVHVRHIADIVPFRKAAATNRVVPASATLIVPCADNIPDFVRVVIEGVIEDTIRLKNVPLEPRRVVMAADIVLAGMALAELYQLAAGNQVTAGKVAGLICANLDEVAVQRMLRVFAGIENKPVDDPLVLSITAAAIKAIAAKQDPNKTMVWPDPFEAACHHYRTTPRGPIVDEMPEGVLTTYWLAGDLHRDPHEGPARHYTDGTREWSEYWVNGMLHRPSAEGPAFVYSHCEGREVAGEEYFEHGLWHRPAADGPAIRHFDRDGTCVREVYYQRGERHRDSKEGPAWRGIENGVSVEEYVEHNVFHRDEADGPALIGRDMVTGERREEIYYRDGQLHRENGPAATCWEPDGAITESWYRNGDLHRDPKEGPAFVARDTTGRVTTEAFYQDGVFLESRDVSSPPNRRARRAAKVSGRKSRPGLS